MTVNSTSFGANYIFNKGIDYWTAYARAAQNGNIPFEIGTHFSERLGNGQIVVKKTDEDTFEQLLTKEPPIKHVKLDV